MENFDDINVDSTSSYKPPTAFQMTFDKMIGDMRFVGMFVIIYGALYCISIIGALIGVPLIIAGLRIRESADQFAIYRTTNDSGAMRSGFQLQGKYFNIFKILIIIMLVLFVLSIILVAFLIMYGVGAMMNAGNYS